LLTAPIWAAEGVNINTASAEEIAAALNGVGIAKAEEIVRYREEHGAFTHADELVNVKGVGLRTVDKNRELIIVENTRVAPQE
jgi:competence protein ComEA